MPLYLVIHRHYQGQAGYQNTIVARDQADAIARRNADLDLSPAEEGTYDVSVDTVPDPDGARERRWLELFG